MLFVQGALVLLLAITPHLGLGSEEPDGIAPPSGKALLLDVSSYQGSVNWDSVAESGVRGVYHKLTEGQDFLDPAWSGERREALLGAGLHYGFYHFLRPRKRPAEREVRWFANQAKRAGGWGSLRPAIDIEDTELGPRATGSYLANFIQGMRQRGVKRMLLYASPIWWQENVALVPRLRRELRYVRPWIAHWGVSQPSPLQGMRGWVLHQYTASGRVPGISGDVDINRAPRMQALRR